MAGRVGATVGRLGLDDGVPEGSYDAVLYDLDDVPAHRQRDVLLEILRGAAAGPRAVHGYGISEKQAISLSLRGVAVAQRLDLDLFRVLWRAVRRNPARIPPDDALVERTWVMLADPTNSHRPGT
jgi:hypothetical protein